MTAPPTPEPSGLRSSGVQPIAGTAASRASSSFGTTVDWEDRDSIIAYVRRKCQDAGIDWENPIVQGFVAMIQPGEHNASLIDWTVTYWASQPTMGVGGSSYYADALQRSQFGPVQEPAPSPRAGAMGGIATAPGFIGPVMPPGPETQPSTGWQQWPNGVLVNPEALSPWAADAVYFPPGEMIPGSPTYIRAALEWDADKRKEWTARLREYGYLGEEKSDDAFATALTEYWRAYYYYGKFVSSDRAGGGAGAEPEFEMGPRDIIGEIRNSVRANFEQIYGEPPGDYELGMWTRFIVSESKRLQKVYEKRGMTPESAFGAAVGEAEERFYEKMSSDPDAQALENTRLRDSLTEAVYITRALGS